MILLHGIYIKILCGNEHWNLKINYTDTGVYDTTVGTAPFRATALFIFAKWNMGRHVAAPLCRGGSGGADQQNQDVLDPFARSACLGLGQVYRKAPSLLDLGSIARGLLGQDRLS